MPPAKQDGIREADRSPEQEDHEHEPASDSEEDGRADDHYCPTEKGPNLAFHVFLLGVWDRVYWITFWLKVEGFGRPRSTIYYYIIMAFSDIM